MPSRIESFRTTARTSGVLWAGTLAVDQLTSIGLQRLWRPSVVSADRLGRQTNVILRAWGLSEEHAGVTVERMLYADLRGIDSHGCAMLPAYAREFAAGSLNPQPSIAVLRETDTTALLDGGGGLGHVPATMAMTRAIEKARERGVAVVTVRRSGHFGAAGAYAAMAATHGLIGFAFTTTPTPAVVPTGGSEARLGTNPLSMAAPARRHRPFLLDMSTSVASLGKLVEIWRRGDRIPERWARTRQGQPITHGFAAARDRRLAPLGGFENGAGHKGYGLAVAVEILAGVMPDAHAGDGAAGRAVGHCFMAIDPARFNIDDAFEDRLDDVIDRLRATPARDPRSPVLVAGDPEAAALATRSASGIPLARGVVEDIRRVAATASVPFLLT